jgi:hypothetical protein
LETGPRSYGPEPIFGEYKYESDDNGTVETIRYWSTILTEEVQSSIESDIVNSTHCTNKDSKLPDKDLKLPANDFPETVDVVVGMDHGQGALRGFAKILLASPELQKEKGDLSYGCPIVKLCHVQCKKDTYRVIKNTAIPLLNDSINHLQGSKCIIVTDKARQLVQACLVPHDCTDVQIDADRNLCYTNNELVQVQVPLDEQFNQTSCTDLCIDASIKGFKVYITGDLAFYVAVLGKADSSGSWCTWCDAKKSWFGMKDLLQDAAKWTCEMLRKAKCRFDARTARRNRNYNGVSADQLLDVEPGDFIFPVLHVQMGLVNKALSHLVAWFEKHVEKLADGHADTRTKLIEAETEYEEAMEAYDAFVTVEPFLSLATKRKVLSKVSTKVVKEILKGSRMEETVYKNQGNAPSKK